MKAWGTLTFKIKEMSKALFGKKLKSMAILWSNSKDTEKVQIKQSNTPC